MYDQTSTHSTYFEKLTEHIFISELLQEVLLRHGFTVDVLRSEIDSSGYDLALKCNGILRHEQLKSSKLDAARAYQAVNVALAKKPHGCVVWIFRDVETSCGRFKLAYRLLEGPGGERLSQIEGLPAVKHTKGDATGRKTERPNIKRVPKSLFRKPCNIDDLAKRLFRL